MEVTRKAAARWLTSAVILFASACSQDGSASSSRTAEPGESPGEIGSIVAAAAPMLTEAQLAEYSGKALLGDGEAAFRMYLHYITGADLRNADFWVRIAAENGDISGMINYAEHLLDVPRSQECLRASFWANRAIAMADSEAERGSVQHLMGTIKNKCPQMVQR